MVETVYVVQTFSRDRNGALTRDAPTWSQDRSFAVSLTHALSKRKAGVVTIGVALEAADDLGSEAEIIASHGSVPLEMIFPATLGNTESTARVSDVLMKRRA